MAHLIERMAYVGETPWHGLGSQLPPKQPLEVWAKQAGMDWSIRETPVCYRTNGIEQDHAVLTFEDQKVLYRSDTGSALSVVGDRYRVVQPREVLEFYRDLTDVFGYELETAGVLKGGRKLWALARTGQDAMLKNQDTVCSYLLLATSCDGTLATMAMPTTVRVVCNNTLAVALKGANNAVKVPHSTTFDPMAVKKQLGIATSQWGAFLYRIQTMANRKVKASEASKYFDNVLNLPANLPAATAPANGRALKRMQDLFDGQGRGAELSTAKGTTWGLLNAVTEFVDHERRARSREYRLESAWFGQGAAVKQRAFDLALDMVL
jgi:phage/plasmid-like protein (TIGR03299 family)